MLDQQQLAQLVRRVEALEARGEPANPDAKRISKRVLADRWGVSARTVDRLREVAGFPRPEIVNGRCYWRVSSIVEYERARAASEQPAIDYSRLKAKPTPSSNTA